MSTLELKIDLHNMIDKVEDNKILNTVKSILSSYSKDKVDWWHNISEDERADIIEGIKQANKGDTFTTKEVMEDYQKWL